MEYFLNPKEAEESTKAVKREGRFSLSKQPPTAEIIRLDREVIDRLSSVMDSKQAARLREHLEDARVKMIHDPQHSGIDYIFRAVFLDSWAHDLFLLHVKPSGVTSSRVDAPFRRQCTSCFWGTGYRGPTMSNFEWTSRGDVMPAQTLSDELAHCDRVIVADLAEIRRQGAFDEILRTAVKTLSGLGVLAGDYIIHFIVLHHFADGRKAMFSMAPMDVYMPAPDLSYELLTHYHRDYYFPCMACKGTGVLLEDSR